MRSLLSVMVLMAAVSAVAQPARDNPYMKYTDRQEWQTEMRVQIEPALTRSGRDRDSGQQGGGRGFGFEKAVVILPALKRTGSSLAYIDGVRVLGEKDDRRGPLEFSIEGDIEETADLLPAGARLARVDAGPAANVRRLAFTMSAAHSCFATEFNEGLARRIEWPESWPPEAAACFRDELFVTTGPDGEDQREAIRGVLEKMTRGKDPKKLAPLDLAKFLTAELLAEFQLQSRAVRTPAARTGSFNPSRVVSFPVRASGRTAGRSSGTPADLVTLWVALMREAGLPARVVIGYDLGENISNRRGQPGYPEDDPGVRIWAEFALYDAGRDILTWVPVDVVRLSESTSARLDWSKPWQFFGTHEQLSSIVPISHHWVPPVVSESYGPACWGWIVTPAPPVSADQAVNFHATSPNIGGRRPRLESAPGLASGVAGDR